MNLTKLKILKTQLEARLRKLEKENIILKTYLNKHINNKF
jgi:hypothetical protein